MPAEIAIVRCRLLSTEYASGRLVITQRLPRSAPYRYNDALLAVGVDRIHHLT